MKIIPIPSFSPSAIDYIIHNSNEESYKKNVAENFCRVSGSTFSYKIFKAKSVENVLNEIDRTVGTSCFVCQDFFCYCPLDAGLVSKCYINTMDRTVLIYSLYNTKTIIQTIYIKLCNNIRKKCIFIIYMDLNISSNDQHGIVTDIIIHLWTLVRH